MQVPSGHTRELVDHLVATQALLLKEEYGHFEKELAISIADHPQKASHVMAADSQTKLLSLLCMLPHGVIKWSHAVPGGSYARHISSSLRRSAVKAQPVASGMAN